MDDFSVSVKRGRLTTSQIEKPKKHGIGSSVSSDCSHFFVITPSASAPQNNIEIWFRI